MTKKVYLEKEFMQIRSQSGHLFASVCLLQNGTRWFHLPQIDFSSPTIRSGPVVVRPYYASMDGLDQSAVG